MTAGVGGSELFVEGVCLFTVLVSLSAGSKGRLYAAGRPDKAQIVHPMRLQRLPISG